MKKQATTLLITAALFQNGCARSSAFQQDQDVNQDMQSSYYNKPGQPGENVTQRIEAMGQPKKKVVVFTFYNETPMEYSDLGPFAADELRRGLYVTQRMIVPQDAKSDLESKDFVQGDDIRVAQLIREGRRLGVALAVIGRVSKVVFRQRGDEVGILRQVQSLAAVNVEIKLFDIAQGREIMAVGKSGEASNNSMVALEEGNLESREYRAQVTKLAIRSAMQQLVPDVVRAVEKMSWQGLIAKVIGTKVYLNSGRASGLVGGDILKVLTPGDDVYDPESGAFLGRTQGQLKGTVEVVDFVGDDAAVSSIHSGGQFKEGDQVKLY